ncbi:hypothetical protein QM306_40610, partial [Burkholderia cenocepacia]|nr:hypothetical protein [Burkholderia cenocepacia]
MAAATGAPLEPAFGGASLHDLETACALADDAFDTYRETSLDARAAFLDAIGLVPNTGSRPPSGATQLWLGFIAMPTSPSAAIASTS